MLLMNAIMGMAALALRTDLSDKQRDYLSKIDLSAHALLSEVIEGVITNVALKAGEKGLEIAFTVAREVPE